VQVEPLSLTPSFLLWHIVNVNTALRALFFTKIPGYSKGATTHIITAFSIKGLYVTLIISDIKHINTAIIISVAFCLRIMLSVDMLIVVLLSVDILSVILLSVVVTSLPWVTRQQFYFLPCCRPAEEANVLSRFV
jgi:hypothetical protein